MQTAPVLNAEEKNLKYDMEFHKTVEKGHQEMVKQLRDENQSLRDTLRDMISSITETVNGSVEEIQKVQSSLDNPGIHKQISKVIKRCCPEKAFRNECLMIELPKNIASEHLPQALSENAKRFKKFLKLVVNPVNISELIQIVGTVNFKYLEESNVIEPQIEEEHSSSLKKAKKAAREPSPEEKLTMQASTQKFTPAMKQLESESEQTPDYEINLTAP